MKLDAGAYDEIYDAAIGPGFFLMDIIDSLRGESAGVGVLRSGRYTPVFAAPNGEESRATVDYINVLDGQLHATVTSNVDGTRGVFRAPFTGSRARRQRAIAFGLQSMGASPFSGDTYVRLRPAGDGLDLVTSRLTFRR